MVKTLAWFIPLVIVLMVSPAFADAESCAIQGRLKVLGFYEGAIDCAIGPETEAAITAFQGARGLPQTGNVGPQTYGKLFGRERGDDSPYHDVKGGDRCSNEVIEASKEGLGKTRGTRFAIEAWQSLVYGRDGLGPRYGNYDNAIDKSEECIRASAGARFTYNCTVKARPCKAN